MPIYNYNGETYDIPLSLSTKFESDMPDASVQMYDRSGNSYSIPLQLQGAFKRDHEGWSYDAPQSKPNNESDGAPKKQKVSVAPKPMDERGYVFNESELMGESTEYKDNTPPARTLKGIVDAQKPKTMADVDWSKVNANIDFSTEKNPYPQYTGEDVAKNFEKQRIAQQNQEEDSKVDKQYTPKEENTAMDVYDNYMNRFALTKEGSALQKELADIEGKVTNKYIEEFKTSDAYKNIMALYDGSEDSKERVSTLLNETFVKEYGERINNDIAPYRKAYIDEMQTRYGDRFNESIKAVARKENASTVNTLYQEVRDLQKEIGGHSYVSSPSTHAPIKVSGGTDAEALLQAEKLLRDSRNVIEEATKHKDSGFISGVGRGVRDNLSPEDFTFGISDLADEKRLNNILGRYEKGEKVSDAEMKLLEASAANMVTHAYYDMMLSSGYKAGQVTAESLPFMLEFVANPIAGSGKALAKGLLKVALKKFGSKAINAGTKFGARLLGDALAAGGMTLTSGLAGVEAEATRRMNEGYDYGMRDGKLYVERKPDAISWGEARGKAFAQRAIENQSEMVFNAFSGVGKVLGGKGSILSKLSESKGGKFIKDAFNNKYIKEIAESTQFHGLPVEYMEEVYNNGANVLLGEMSVEDFADVDKNVETFLGLAPTSVVFGLLGLGGMAIDKVSNRRELNRIYNSLPDDLREQYNRVMQSKGYNAESTKEFVKGVITNPRATEEEKAAAIRLGYCTVADMTYEDAEQAEQSGDVPVTPGNNNEDDVTEGTGVGPSLVEGGRAVGRELYAEHDVTKMRRAYLRALYSMNRLRSVAGDDVVTALDRAESDAEFEAIISSLPEEYKRYASDYVAQRLAMDGLDEALDARYSEDAALAESVVSSVFDGGKRMVPIARLDDNRGIVVLNGIESDGSILTADGSVMGVRVPLVDGMPDWKSFDASAVRSYRIKDEDVISTATPNTVTEVLLADKLADEASISTASPISVGAQFPVLLDGELRDVRVVGQNGQNWLVEVTGEKGFEAVSPRELELWKHQAEMLAIEQEYQEIDNKAINNDKGIGEESRVERNEADDAVGVSPVGEGAHEVGVQERPEVGFVDASSGGRARPSNSGGEDSVSGAVEEVPGNGVKASALSRLAVYPDGHVKAGRPDYESSRVEDVRDYLVESLGEEKALKAVNSTIAGTEGLLAEKADRARRLREEVDNSSFEVDDMLRAQHDVDAADAEVATLQKSVDYWKEVRTALGGEDVDNSELDENGRRFVLSSDGTTIFGEIREESGLSAAPIKLSEGYQDENGKGYGLKHIEANHGEQIRNAGFSSVEEFVSYVAKNYDENNIRVGNRRTATGDTTYLIQVSDAHDNTLYIELSRDGSYWNVNSGGIFRKGYSNKKETVVKTEPQQPNNAVSTDSSLSEDVVRGIATTEPNGEPTVSLSKDNVGLSDMQEKVEETVEQDNKVSDNTLSQKIASAESEVNTTPSEGQKKAGNYKKGHVQIGSFNVTIEQPKGSVRSGVDKDGKKWSTTMQNTYGYIRGTEGVDGDHIDVFLSDDIDGWDGRKVFVVDQYNPDGSFDEHKVMLGFNDIDEADAAYLSNYEEGWSDSRKIVIRPSTLEDFEKWINSSHRKTKPFSEYSSVEENRRKPLRERVAEWANKLGIDIVVLENLDEVTNSQAREAIASGDGRYPGWYGEKSGKVYIYLPHVTDVKDIDETVVHEVVAHKGLRRLMGEKFDALCDMVWDSMSKENREKFMSYPGVNGNHRAAADEYMAYIAEKTELTEEERGIWDKIVQFVKDLITLNLGVKLSDAQIAGLIRASYAEMKREAGKQKEAEATDTTTHDTKNTSRERHDELLMIATEARKAMGERQAVYFPQLPKQRDLVAAYEKNDSKEITTWKKQFEDVLSKMVPLDIPMVESTIDNVLYVRDAQKHNKDSALYKAYNDIAKMLRKQKSKLESQLTDSDRDVLNAIAYSRGKGTRFSAKGYNPIAEKEVENIVVDTNGVSYSKDVALNKIPIGGLVKTNIDTGKNIKVSRKSLRHSALHDLKAVYAAFDRIEDIVVNAVKIGEIPVANDEIGKTNSVSIFYIPINIDGVQYSARLVVKELINKDEVLDDLSLYNMAMHKEKTPSNTNVGTSNDELVYSDSVISVYKVKDLIHNTQEIDKKILNLDEETRFRRAKDSKSLVAVHNLSENNLRKVLEAGGLIMPSIAITDVNMGHSGYGEISLLFDKDTINPSDRRNKVYGGDAWTPRFPQMVPKLNGEVLKSIRNKIYNLLDEKLQSFYSLSAELHPTNMEPAIADRGIDSFYGKEWMKIAYLLDNGKKFKVPMKMKDYGTMAEPIIKLAKDRGLSLSDIHNEGYEFYKNNPDFVEAVQELKIEQRLSSVAEEEREKVRELLKQRPTGFNAFDTYISQALSMENDLNNGGLKQVIDRMALYDAINKKVKTDNADYNKWVDNLFDGVVEKYGIRNNRDWYTPSGNSRPWEQLYDPATPANILRHMLADNEQGGSGGLWDSNIMGASAETYESIDVIREKGKKRLHKVSADEYDAWTNSVSDRFAEICDEFMTDAQKNDFGGIIDAKITITNAVAKDKTAKGIYKIMSKEYPKFTMEHAKRVEEIVKEIQDYATTYFEAKPQRIVELSEVRKAIVPSDVSSDILEGLEKNGIDVATYRKGNEQSRARLIKKESEGLRFRVANRNQVGFVSNAMKAVEGIKQEKATPQQWLAMIEKQGGLKAGEDKWLGLSDWLKSSDKKTLTKDEVLEFIGENMIRIEEVKYVEQPEVLYFDDYEVYNEWQELGGDKKAFNELAEKYGDDFTIAFSYDETFGIVNVDDAEAAMLFGGYDKGTIGNPINSTRLDYTTEGLDNKREIALTVPTIESWNEYDDIHFGDAGGGRAVAWIRFGEATTYENVDDVQQVTDFHEPYKDVNGLDIYKPIGSFRNGDFIAHGKGRNGDMIYVVYINGNQVPVSYKTLDDARVGMNEYYNAHPRKLRKPLKVLVIDEIQSKRHQEGREKGYKNEHGGVSSGIPSAPFEKNWHELAMKRMLRLAAEEGFDKVAWTTGAQQTERYNIGTMVRDIEVLPVTDAETGEVLDAEFDVYTHSNSGNYISEATGRMNTEQIMEVFGKDLGGRIIEGGRTQSHTVISGKGLNIGGEGMKGFYDRMLPSFVNKYVKKWGTKVGEVELPELEESAQKMWSVDVTKQMKAEVEEQVMFRKVSEQIEDMFDSAISGDLKGKPISIGKLTVEGKEYLEFISGLTLKNDVDFVLNPSDLVHIYNEHYGDNEKDKGNNIPLTKHDIKRMVDVIAFPTEVIYGEGKNGRKSFYFLMDTPDGAYNLLEVYADKKGNLSSKTYYKTKKGVSQRVMNISSSLHSTSVADGATLSDVKVPQMFESANISEEKVLFRVDEDVPELMPGESVSDFLVRLKSWRRKNSENEFTKNQSPLRSLYEVIDEYESMLKSKDKEIRSLDERLRHYANRLSKTEKRNMALIKDRNTINDLRSEIERFIRKQISSDFVSYMRKSDLNNLLHQMHSTNNMDELENILLNVNTIVRRAEIRHTWNTLDRLLSLKVQGVNGRNMSIARNVDDSTRRIFSYIRGTVADLRLSGYEEEMTELRKKGKALTEDLKEAENELSDATDEATKNDIMTRIEQIKKKQDERKNRMKELETLSEEAKKAKGDDTVNNIESELSAMQAIYEEKTEKGTWTTEDNERLTALNLMQLISHNSRMSSAMTELEKGIDLDYNSIIHEKNPDKLESAWAALKGKKMEYANALNQQLIELSHTVKELRGLIEGGRKSLLARREAEAERRRNILLNGIQSVRGKHVNIMSNELRGRKGFFGVVDRVRNFITLPLASFEYMTQRISTTTGPSEDSWLYKYFVKGKDGVLAAYDTYKKGIRQAKDAMDAESENIFGKNKRFSDLMIESDKVIEKSGVYKLNNNDDPSRGYDEMIEVPLSKGQAMYIYMVWKMDDGRSKLTVQGFNENSIAAIRRFIGEKYVAYADWIQGTFLKDLRKKYNDKYLEIYDTSLAEIKNYVPLRIRKESVRQESDLSDDKQSHKTLEQRAGSLINRVVNVNPVDINMNGFAVIADHVNQMEEWDAYARVRKDLDYLLSNNYFRNQLNTNRPGSFERFYEAASVATASYRPDDSNYSDSIWKKLSKGVIGGNIAYRLNTALKQVLSFPAFAGYSTNLKYQAILMKRLGTIKGNVEWAYEHLPSFYERVASGSLGDEKLDANGLNKFLDKAIETGMLPNKWVDAIACSCGARSIYEFRFKQLTEDIQARNLPFIEKRRATEEAHRLALREADLYYNKTQQSSHPAYLSPMQLSGTFLNSMLTTYQNSNIGYVRMTVLSYVELKKTLKKDAWVKSRTDYYIENGYDNAEAHDKAVSDWWSHHSKYLIRVLLFGWVLNLLWNLGSNGLLGFMNGDDDEPTVDEMIGFAISSPIRGVPAGNIIEGSLSGYGYHPFLVFEELDEIVRESATAYKEHGLVSPELAYEILSTGSRVAGFDLEVWGNMYMGIEGMMRSSGDAEHMTMDLMFLLNVPKRSRSQIAKYLYKDKSPLEFATALMRARKYVPQNDLWEKWVPGTKYVDKRQTTKTLKEIDELKSGVPSTKSDKETELSPTQRYNSLVELQDIIEDHELQKKMGEYKAVVDGYEELDAGNDWRAAEDYYNRHVDVIDAYDEALEIRSEINSEKKNLGKGDDEAVMRKIRELRKELFEKL